MKSLIADKTRLLYNLLQTLLLVITLYACGDMYNWMVYQKYQVDEARILKGLDHQVDKQLGLDKLTEPDITAKEERAKQKIAANKRVLTACLAAMAAMLLVKHKLIKNGLQRSADQ